MWKFLSKKKPEECSTTNVTNCKGIALSGKEKAFIGFTILHAVLLFINLYLFINSYSSTPINQKEGWFWGKITLNGNRANEDKTNSLDMFFSMIFFATSLFFTIFWYFCQIFFMVLYMLCTLIVNVIYYALAIHWKNQHDEQKRNEKENKMTTTTKRWWENWMVRWLESLINCCKKR